MPKRDLGWWFWLATFVSLAAGLLVDRAALAASVVLCVVQVPVFAAKGSGLASFPAQLRIAFLVLLFLGFWPPFGLVHWIQLVGTGAFVTTGYCFLARSLSLLPFNRSGKLSRDLVRRTFLTPPVKGSILSAL